MPILYGLNYNWPNIEQTGQVWICEGEKGVMKLDTMVINHAVAMLGNNLGINRRNTLIKYGVKDVVLDCDFIGKENFEEIWKSGRKYWVFKLIIVERVQVLVYLTMVKC